MNNEKETRGTLNAQGSGKTSSSSRAVNAGANMNPEAEGTQGWATTQGRTSANRTIGDRLSRQYNGLSQTQKIVGASLLGAAAVGAAYLTRNMWTGKNTWTAQGQSNKKKSNSQPSASAKTTSSTEKQNQSSKASRSTSGELTM